MKTFLKKVLPKWMREFILRIIHAIKGMRYPGSKVLCTCCGRRFGKFVDQYPGKHQSDIRWAGNSESVFCPYCESAARHRIACHWLELHMPFLNRDCRILMVGAEWSIENYFYKKGYKNVTTIDLYDPAADVLCDIQKTQFADNSMDIITCNHVLEHVSDYKMALREMHRIMSHRGILELSVPTDYNLSTTYEDANIISKTDRLIHFGQEDHLRIFGRDFKQQVELCGFIVEVVAGNNVPKEIRPIVHGYDYNDNHVYFCRKILN
ncbi:MAG: class I SAM-dependent methyltransferase [Prevotellaceae bacterium]|jgi:hypothetical protein|nr:class I SAM-dependent methyltransferase [Prevotellaceae bacterium]